VLVTCLISSHSPYGWWFCWFPRFQGASAWPEGMREETACSLRRQKHCTAYPWVYLFQYKPIEELQTPVCTHISTQVLYIDSSTCIQKSLSHSIQRTILSTSWTLRKMNSSAKYVPLFRLDAFSKTNISPQYNRLAQQAFRMFYNTNGA